MAHINGYHVFADDSPEKQAEVLAKLEAHDPALAKIVSRFYEGSAKRRQQEAEQRRREFWETFAWGVGALAIFVAGILYYSFTGF